MSLLYGLMAIRKKIRDFFSSQRAEKRFLSLSQDSFDPYTLFDYEIKRNRFLALIKQISHFNITNLLSYCHCYNHNVFNHRLLLETSLFCGAKCRV